MTLNVDKQGLNSLNQGVQLRVGSYEIILVDKPTQGNTPLMLPSSFFAS